MLTSTVFPDRVSPAIDVYWTKAIEINVRYQYIIYSKILMTLNYISQLHSFQLISLEKIRHLQSDFTCDTIYLSFTDTRSLAVSQHHFEKGHTSIWNSILFSPKC